LSEHSLFEWYRLDSSDRSTVIEAVDRGERVEDRLRPAARALAETSLHKWGTGQFRRSPGRILTVITIDLAVVAFMIIKAVMTGSWWPVWLIVVVIGASIGVLWNMERQARRLRPIWQQAIEANRDRT